MKYVLLTIALSALTQFAIAFENNQQDAGQPLSSNANILLSTPDQTDTKVQVENASLVINLDLPPLVDITSGPQPDAQLELAHQDLTAQNRMAKGTDKMAKFAAGQFWVSVIGLAMSIFGVLFLAWTLTETRKSTKAAQLSASTALASMNQNRAWIFVEVKNVCIYNNEYGNSLQAVVTIKNTAPTPAMNMELQVKATTYDVSERNPNVFLADLRPVEESIVRLAPNSKVKIPCTTKLPGAAAFGINVTDPNIALVIRVQYDTIFTDKACITHEMYKIEIPDAKLSTGNNPCTHTNIKTKSTFT